MLRFLEGITQQALKFALQYLIENHCITWLLLFCIDCTVSLDYLQKFCSKCFIDSLISITAPETVTQYVTKNVYCRTAMLVSDLAITVAEM